MLPVYDYVRREGISLARAFGLRDALSFATARLAVAADGIATNQVILGAIVV